MHHFHSADKTELHHQVVLISSLVFSVRASVLSWDLVLDGLFFPCSNFLILHKNGPQSQWLKKAIILLYFMMTWICVGFGRAIPLHIVLLYLQLTSELDWESKMALLIVTHDNILMMAAWSQGWAKPSPSPMRSAKQSPRTSLPQVS